MHKKFEAGYIASSGPLHFWDPRLKLLLLLLLLSIFTFTFSQLDPTAMPRMLLLAVLLISVALYARIAIWRLLLFSCWILPMAAGMSFGYMFNWGVSTTPLPFGLPELILPIRFEESGLQQAALLLARSYLSTFATLLMLVTTSQWKILNALQEVRLPTLLINLIHVILTTAKTLRIQEQKLRKALLLRGGSRGIDLWLRHNVHLLAALFIIALHRGDQSQAALRLRGFTGTFVTLDPLHWQRFDTTRLLVALLLLMPFYFPWRYS